MSRGILFAFGSAILWGLSYTIDQKVLQNISPLAFLFIGNVVTLLVLLPFAIANMPSLEATLRGDRSILLLAVLALLLGIFGNFLIYSSIALIGASIASLIEIAYPLVVVLCCYFLYQTSPSAIVLFGGLLVFAGSAIIAYFGR